MGKFYGRGTWYCVTYSLKINYFIFSMPIRDLRNITVKKLTDKNSKPYFLIINNDYQEEVYFCFAWTIKEGWEELVNNWENLSEVKIEFTENGNNFPTYRKVMNLWTSQEEEIFI